MLSLFSGQSEFTFYTFVKHAKNVVMHFILLIFQKRIHKRTVKRAKWMLFQKILFEYLKLFMFFSNVSIQTNVKFARLNQNIAKELNDECVESIGCPTDMLKTSD